MSQEEETRPYKKSKATASTITSSSSSSPHGGGGGQAPAAAVDIPIPAKTFPGRKDAIRKAITQHKALLDRLEGQWVEEWTELEGQWRDLEEEKAAMARYGGEGVHEDEILELNVGGQPMDVRR